MDSLLAKLAMFSAFIVMVSMTAEAQLMFDTHFVEQDTSKMVTTGDSNYAICNHHYPSNWRSASVNGDEVTIATRDKMYLQKRLNQLTSEERTYLETVHSNLSMIIRNGVYNVRSEKFAKLTTFDRNGGMSSSSAGSVPNDSSSSSSSTSDGTNIQRTSKDSFIYTKPDLPFNWQRVFVNEDVATVVHKNGRVIMLPQDLMRPDESAKIQQIRQEVDKASKSTENLKNQLSGSMKNPMDFVNKALSGFFG